MVSRVYHSKRCYTLYAMFLMCVVVFIINKLTSQWPGKPLPQRIASLFQSARPQNLPIQGPLHNGLSDNLVTSDDLANGRPVQVARNLMPRLEPGLRGVRSNGSQANQSQRHDKSLSVKKAPKPSASTNVSMCPDDPPNLIGSSTSIQEEIGLDELEAILNESNTMDKYSTIEIGGHFKPQECLAVQKLAIVIPYRNRHSHLIILLMNLVPILRRQQSDFRIFVIDQDMPTTFNRGMLQNVGFLEALKYDNFDCFVFHDVDMLPLNDNCLYRCGENPMHLTAAVNKWKYGLPYNGYFGGVTAFSRQQYQKINGNSNLYFGWGGEDDDLRMRIVSKRYKVVRYPKSIGIYDMIKHDRDSGNKNNPDRINLLKTSTSRQEVEGLSTAKYNVTAMELKPLMTWIHVSINMNEVLETTPHMTTDAIQLLLRQAKRN